MFPYVAMFLVLAVTSVITQLAPIRSMNRYLYFIPVGLLIFFGGLRVSGVGSDDHNYEYIFNEMPTLVGFIESPDSYDLSSHRKEVGFLVVNLILKSVSNDYTVLFLFCAFFSVGIAGSAYKHLSPFPYISLLLFFVHTYLYRDMNQIRAAMAAAICLHCVPCIARKAYFKAVLVVLAASLFHVASLCMFLAMLFALQEPSRKKVYIYVSLSIFLGTISISSIILSFLPGLNTSIAASVVNYSESEMYSQDLGMWNITNVKSLAILLVLTIFFDSLRSRINYFSVMYSFYALGVCWRLAFSDFAILAGRIATFFEIVEVVLVPGLILLVRQRSVGYFLVFAYAFSMFYLNMFVVVRRSYEWVLSGWL